MATDILNQIKLFDDNNVGNLQNKKYALDKGIVSCFRLEIYFKRDSTENKFFFGSFLHFCFMITGSLTDIAELWFSW